MRAAHLIIMVVALAAAACTPEIGPNTYYCGPERFCPPGLVCDDNIYSCVEDFQEVVFSCPAGSTAFEPDDSTDTAHMPGPASCGSAVLSDHVGCVQGGDADYVELRTDDACTGGNPHFEIKLLYPVATMPLTVEILDAAGAVLQTGEICTPNENLSGREHLCAEMTPTAGETYFVRVRAADGAVDCSGDCAHNQYVLDIEFPLS